MQDRMNDGDLKKWETSRGQIMKRKDANIPYEERADFASYHHIREDGSLEYYLPTEHIRQCLINGGKYVKAKVGNARRSMTNLVAGMFFIQEKEISLPKWDILDERSAVNHKADARIMKYRPMWSQWKAVFVLEVRDHEKTITKEMIKEIFLHAGTKQGIGSYRVEHKGEFGQFALTYLERLDAPDKPLAGNSEAPKKRGRKPKNS
jgi:hypothetical protein